MGKPFKRFLLLALAAVSAVAVVAWRSGEAPPRPARADFHRTGDADPDVPQGWRPPHRSRRWECIVIHHSASEIGGAERFDDYHRDRGFDELGYHFVIGNGSDTPTGRVEVGSRWAAQKHGAHCKTSDEYYNQRGIGICLVGNFDRHEPDDKQLRSLTRLVRFLCREYDIPPSKIYTHGGVTGQTRCPGKEFDLNELRNAIR